MDEFLINQLKQIIEQKKQIQPALGAYKNFQPAIENYRIIKHALAILKNIPPDIRKLVTLEEDEWNELIEDEPLVEDQELKSTLNYVSELISELREIFQSERVLFEYLQSPIDEEEYPYRKPGEKNFQRKPPGPKPKRLDNKLHELVNLKIISEDKAFDLYCVENNIKNPIKKHRDRFKKAMKRRDAKGRPNKPNI